MTASSPKSPVFASNPLVTIAIPTFNRASWLQSCVRSALAQSYKNFEVLVSDNASTDETTQVLNQLHDRQLRVVRQAINIGPVANWNACLGEAKGEYIVFVPDDDKVEPWLLERCVAIARSDPALPIIVALSDIDFVAKSRRIAATPNPKLATGILDGADILSAFLNSEMQTQMCTIMFRTDVLRAKGGFRNDIANVWDIATWAPVLLIGKAGLVNESCGSFAVHNSSESSNMSAAFNVSQNRKLADLIIDEADRAELDFGKRGKVKQAARRFFAHRAIEILSLYRSEGATFADTFAMAWPRRRDLRHIGLQNILILAGPIAVLFLPVSIANCIRRLKLLCLGKSQHEPGAPRRPLDQKLGQGDGRKFSCGGSNGS